MLQFGTSAINTVVHWHELDEVENECTSYNFRQFAIFVPKIVKFGGIWRSYDKNACFLRYGVYKNNIIGLSVVYVCLLARISYEYSWSGTIDV